MISVNYRNEQNITRPKCYAQKWFDPQNDEHHKRIILFMWYIRNLLKLET